MFFYLSERFPSQCICVMGPREEAKRDEKTLSALWRHSRDTDWNSLVFIYGVFLTSQRQFCNIICCLTVWHSNLCNRHHSCSLRWWECWKYRRVTWQHGSKPRGRWWVMIIWSEKDDSRPQTVTRHLLTGRFVSLTTHCQILLCMCVCARGGVMVSKNLHPVILN